MRDAGAIRSTSPSRSRSARNCSTISAIQTRCCSAPKRPNASASERGIALLGEIMAEISRGVAWLRAGRLAEALTQLDQGIERLMQTGHRIWIWYLRALRAEALALTGDLDGAWTLIEESVARIEAGEERSHYAEVLRLKGWILILRGEPDQAAAILRKAIAVARTSARNRGSFAPRPRSPACSRAAAIRPKRWRCWRRSTTGSPKAATPGI